MKEKYLPIGSIVLLKNAQKKIMITGYLPVVKKPVKKIYDYSACVFPEGLISSSQTAAFNHDQIKEIIHEGYSNEETEKFIIALNEIAAKSTGTVSPEGQVPTTTPTVQEQPAAPEVFEEAEPASAPVSIPAENVAVQQSLPSTEPTTTPMGETITEEQIAPVQPDIPNVIPITQTGEELVMPETTPVTTAPVEPQTSPAAQQTVTPVDSAEQPLPASNSSMSETPIGLDSIKPFSE